MKRWIHLMLLLLILLGGSLLTSCTEEKTLPGS